jgi:hypothetical protein
MKFSGKGNLFYTTKVGFMLKSEISDFDKKMTKDKNTMVFALVIIH